MLRTVHDRYQLARLRKKRSSRHLYWAPTPLPIQALAYLALHATYSVIYDGRGSVLSGLEFPITYAVLGVSGVIGGGLALVGLYKVLVYSRDWVAAMVIGLLLTPSLLWAGVCIYTLLIFLAAI